MQKRMILGKRRNEYGKQIRKMYESHRLQAKRGEIADLVLLRSEYSNTITTFQKDNYLCVLKSISGQEE